MRPAHSLPLRRRPFLGGLLGLSLASCQKSSSSSSPSSPPDDRWRDFSFPSPDEQRALVLAPPSANPLPVLIALHGRGESGRGLEVGAKAWRDDYNLDKLDLRLREGPLTRADLADMVEDERLGKLNESLKNHPYEGLVVACPYTPDLKSPSKERAAPFAKFIRDTLLPRVQSESKSLTTRKATGIDGVSMGGRLALLVGFTYPDLFGSIAALQPAIKVDEAETFAALAAAATFDKKTSIRLVSSEQDPFLEAVRALSKALKSVNVAHELLITPGPHDYAWNRGPGGAEMLLWHERVLRGLPPP